MGNLPPFVRSLKSMQRIYTKSLSTVKTFFGQVKMNVSAGLLPYQNSDNIKTSGFIVHLSSFSMRGICSARFAASCFTSSRERTASTLLTNISASG